MTSDPVADLLLLASQQHGAFSWPQANELGWTTAAAHIARRTGEWRRLYRGVYAHRAVWDAFDDKRKHLCLAHGRTLALKPGWLVARRSAALVYDLPMIGDPPRVPQLVRAPATRRARAVSRHERLAAVDEADRCVVDGLLVTSAARISVDIAREEPFRNAVVVADAALRAGATREQMQAVVTRCSAWPGALAAQRAVDFADGLAESALESISRVACHDLNLPAPELQIEVWLGRELIARLDFLWRASNAAGLADGAVKYSDRASVMAEKWQVERLEDLGFEVARWGWDHAWRPRGVLDAKILRAMERGARQQLDPRVRLVPTTVAANVRANKWLEDRRAG